MGLEEILACLADYGYTDVKCYSTYDYGGKLIWLEIYNNASDSEYFISIYPGFEAPYRVTYCHISEKESMIEAGELYTVDNLTKALEAICE